MLSLLACLSVCLPVCLSAYLPACLPACMPVCLSVCLPVCRSVCLSACLPVCLSVSLSVYLPVCLPACRSVCLSIWLAIWLAGWLAGWLVDWLAGCVSLMRDISSLMSVAVSCCVFLTILFRSNVPHRVGDVAVVPIRTGEQDRRKQNGKNMQTNSTDTHLRVQAKWVCLRTDRRETADC